MSVTTKLKYYAVPNRAGEKVIVPTVRNLREADSLAHDFAAVITAGPRDTEVPWNHPNHLVCTFGDTSRPGRWAPTPNDVSKLVAFGAACDDPILVHCHAGMSRSTSTAIGVLLARGVTAETAVSSLAAIHPDGRAFIPNALIIKFLAEQFDEPDLPRIAYEFSYDGLDNWA
jgi:predicted protein tyrosine phosphatase